MSGDEEIAQVVREYGWYAANVFDANPRFLYSIGLMHQLDHPEFIVFGLEPNNAHALISRLIHEIRNGRAFTKPTVESISFDGVKHRVGFRSVHPTQHPLYLGFAMGYCRHQGRIGELEAMQVFWPDENGKFPFEVGCDLSVYELQPRLDLPLTPREQRKFDQMFQ